MKSWQLFAASILSLCTFMSSSAQANFEQATCSIFQRAAESKSDVVMVTINGDPVCIYGQYKEQQPIESRSITKTFLALAVGIMIQEGRIATLDMPVYYFYPEWNQGLKKFVTIRHLLNHTSGISPENEECDYMEVPDIIRFTLASDINNYPGTRFFYNNKATNLLAGIIFKATGATVHEYLKNRLFAPLGITSDTWLSDTCGNNYGMSYLTISAKDLTKVGILLSTGGCWNGIRLLNQNWIDQMTYSSQEMNPFYGLLCWLSYSSLQVHWSQELINLYRKEGINPYYIRCLESLYGRVFCFGGHVSYGNFLKCIAAELANTFGTAASVCDFFAAVESKGLPLGNFQLGKLKTFSARGYQGQQMIVFPEQSIVAVRLARSSNVCYGRVDNFADLEDSLDNLAFQNACRYVKSMPDTVLDNCFEPPAYTQWEQ